MELSTRDRVTLANYTEILEGRGGPNGGVFLDISHRGKDYILEKLPQMYRQMMAFQRLDISKDPMEVAPTAHYSMGGIAVEPEAHATDVDRLFAAGECASGLHGANRLGGNSLVDILVFGTRAGATAAKLGRGGSVSAPARAIEAANDELERRTRPGGEPARRVQERLRELMWKNAGVVRDETRLDEGLRKLGEVRSSIDEVGWGGEDHQELAHLLDLEAGLETAEATLRAALRRAETRGCHNRSDHAALDPDLVANIYVRRDTDGIMSLEVLPVPPIPEALREWGQGEPLGETHEHLLE
jgi:succinate dehydrogenase / fumarate reductase, flavoprotein subunit